MHSMDKEAQASISSRAVFVKGSEGVISPPHPTPQCHPKLHSKAAIQIIDLSNEMASIAVAKILALHIDRMSAHHENWAASYAKMVLLSKQCDHSIEALTGRLQKAILSATIMSLMELAKLFV